LFGLLLLYVMRKGPNAAGTGEVAQDPREPI
jgi:hypothetical protein